MVNVLIFPFRKGLIESPEVSFDIHCNSLQDLIRIVAQGIKIILPKSSKKYTNNISSYSLIYDINININKT